MTDDLDQLRERARQNRDAAPETTTPLVAGTRVLDRVTGQEGVVESLGSIPGVTRPLIAVRLPGGGILLRPPVQLARL